MGLKQMDFKFHLKLKIKKRNFFEKSLFLQKVSNK
jgi:hypothetical protein